MTARSTTRNRKRDRAKKRAWFNLLTERDRSPRREGEWPPFHDAQVHRLFDVPSVNPNWSPTPPPDDEAAPA
jgi:hypothetical protein